jgi:hypothetical protein
MGKGSQQVPTDQTIRQTQLPEYADPYFRRMLQGAEEALMPWQPRIDPETGGIAIDPNTGQEIYDTTYRAYPGERIAPSEMYGDIQGSRAMVRGIAEQGIAGMPEAMGAAQRGMGYQEQAIQGLRGLADYQAGRFDPYAGFAEGQASPYAGFQAQQVTPYEGFQAADTRAFADEFQPYAGFDQARATSMMGEFQAFDPTRYEGFREAEYSPFGEFQQFQFRPAAEFSQFEFRPDYQFQQFQYQQPERFTGAAVEQYMSPYMQSVVEQQQRQAQLEFERQGAARAAQAVQAGAFGGSRQAVQEALAEEALARQVGDIQARGAQTAFEQAAQQFGLDRAARMETEQRQAGEFARVQAGAAAEQARVDQARYTELASREQAQAAEFARAGDQASAEAARVQAAKYQDLARIQAGKASEMGRVQAAQASENARMDAIMQQEAARVQQSRAAEQARLDDFVRSEMARTQAAQAGEMARVQAGRVGELGRAQQLTASELARVQDSQARELARVQGIDVEEARRIQQSEAAELARTQGISIEEAARVQAAQASEAARVQQAIEQSRQFGAGQGLAAFQAVGAGAGQLAGLGAGLASLGERQRAADIQGAQLLETIGRDVRAEDQARLDLAYEDFLRQRDYPITQYERMAGILRGVPVSPNVEETRFASYNPTQQALGAGLSALGLYRGLTG